MTFTKVERGAVPGRQMHAWVAFANSTKVLALNLRRDLSPDATNPPSAPPWMVTVFAFEVPPPGFAMP